MNNLVEFINMHSLPPFYIIVHCLSNTENYVRFHY